MHVESTPYCKFIITAKQHIDLKHKITEVPVQPSIQRVQAFADISCSRYVVIATKPMHRLQTAQYCATRGPTLHSAKLNPGPCSSVGMRRRTDTHRDRHTDARDQ